MGWKTQFSTVWEWKENQRSGKPGETFLSRAHKIFPPKSGGKSVRGNRHDWYFTKIATHQPSFIRLTYPVEDFCPQTHFLSFSHLSFKRPVLQVLLSFLFFLQRDLLVPVRIILLIFLLIFWFRMTFKFFLPLWGWNSNDFN